jgi:hypothetical protein
VATVSGVDYLPQRVREVLSIQRNESPFYPTFGMRFFEYFEAFRGSPWLDLLFKLDVVRQASIPFNDTIKGQMQTPLQCVMRVRGLDLLADKPTKKLASYSRRFRRAGRRALDTRRLCLRADR